MIHAYDIKGYIHIIRAYCLRRFYDTLVFKQVTGKGIFDSSSDCLENMG